MDPARHSARKVSVRPSATTAVLACVLLAGSAPSLTAQAVSGRIVDARSGQPLAFALVVVFERGDEIERTVADTAGEFSIALTGLAGHDVLVTVRRLGYRPASRRLRMPDSRDGVALDVTLDLVPIRLEDVTSAAARRARRLANAGFYDRSREGFGHFVTEEDILERNPHEVTDVLLRIPGVSRIGRSDGSAMISIMRAQGRFASAFCSPKVFVDGVVVATPNTQAFDFDAFLEPEEIAGIEIYRGPAELPVMFGGAESDCGVIVVWTK